MTIIASTVQETPATAASVTSVASSASNVTLLAANPFRIGTIVFNDSTQPLRVKYGATASSSSLSFKIGADEYWEMPEPIWRGQIDGIWDAANGNARITELT